MGAELQTQPEGDSRDIVVAFCLNSLKHALAKVDNFEKEYQRRREQERTGQNIMDITMDAGTFGRSKSKAEGNLHEQTVALKERLRDPDFCQRIQNFLGGDSNQNFDAVCKVIKDCLPSE